MSKVDVAKAKTHKFQPITYTYKDTEVILYALGVGEGTNPTDDSQLKFVYENHPSFRALPTMGVLFPMDLMTQVISADGLSFNPMMLLHGEQRLELRKPIPTSGTLKSYGKITNVYDKGKGAVVILDCITKDQQNEEVCFNQITLFIRGIGGFGGDKGPAADLNQPPNRAPDAMVAEKTLPNHAALYRLTGDRNPLHMDPQMAAMGGFDKPILHGLCTFGYAGRAVLKHFCDNNPENFKSIKARFTKHVFPGETIVTEMWKISDNKVLFQCKVAERPDAGYTLSGGVAEFSGGNTSSSKTSTNQRAKL